MLNPTKLLLIALITFLNLNSWTYFTPSYWLIQHSPRSCKNVSNSFFRLWQDQCHLALRLTSAASWLQKDEFSSTMCAFCVQYPIQPFHQSATCTTLIKKDKNCSHLACVDFILIFFIVAPLMHFLGVKLLWLASVAQCNHRYYRKNLRIYDFL